jgi:predicted metalloendopeptidase
MIATFARRLAIPAVCAIALGAARAAAQQGVNRAYLDTTCAPCRDFFTYANGAWVKNATIPPAYTSAGATRDLLDSNTAALRKVLEATAQGADSARDAALQKLGRFYASCMDSARAEASGYAPIADELRRIDAIRTPRDLQDEFARFARWQITAPFYFSAEVDPKESSRYIGQLYQAGLGLPDREYYRKTDPASDSLRRDYVAHVARTLSLVGAPAERAQRDAERVLHLETLLAEGSMTLVAQRDPNAVYHKLPVRDLQTLAPGIDWRAYFAALDIASLTAQDGALDVSQPEFVRLVSAQVSATPLDDWRAYLRWHLVNATAASLSAAFFNEHFRFESRLRGTREPLPRWKRCAAASDNALGDALGKAYVEREFPPSSKARVLAIVDNLQAAFAERIRHLAWMSDSTKAQALVKLAAVLRKIGYPDKWLDYSALEIGAGAPYATNKLSADRFEGQRQLAKIGGPVDRGEWRMTAPTVNAYYTPTTNEITFPAGILQPPYFNPAADDAVNYGAIGMVIGHELTHGFDDQGRQFDAAGNLKDWWTAEDARRFGERARRVVTQFNGYVAIDTLHVNGELTLGENIADLGGLMIAYDAFERSLAGKPRPAPVDGFTAEQRFFLGYAQGWRSVTRPETARLRALTNPHSPPYWRVNGPVSNNPAFARAFGCKQGDPMVRPDSVRAEVW